jgi:hypothetical protein
MIVFAIGIAFFEGFDEGIVTPLILKAKEKDLIVGENYGNHLESISKKAIERQGEYFF